MSDETNPAQAKEEREATSEGRAEIGPLSGTPGSAAGLKSGTKAGDRPDAAGDPAASGPQPNAGRSAPGR